MKKMASYFILAILFACMSAVHSTAQEEVNYIIVKTAEGEIASFAASAINKVYIENEKWVFELKGASEPYSYPLESVLPFTMVLRKATGIDSQSVVQSDEWNVSDKGNSLVITCPNGKVGYYFVYDLHGKRVKAGYEPADKAIVDVPSGHIYIVKADGKTKKVIKK